MAVLKARAAEDCLDFVSIVATEEESGYGLDD
jgi:hypothetical protein